MLIDTSEDIVRPLRRAPLDLEHSTPGLARRGLHLLAVGADHYRVVDAHGRIVGHIQLVSHELGTRYRARHFNPRRGAFAEFGEFWRVEDAVGSLPLR